MARKPVFDVCMLCGECPCECKKAVKKTVARKATKKVAPPVITVEDAPEDVPPVAPLSPTHVDVSPAPRPDPRAAMRAAAGRARPVTPRASDPAPIIDVMSGCTESSPGDSVMDDAIRALAPLLHPTEKRKYFEVLWTPSALSERAANWRNRRREALGK